MLVEGMNREKKKMWSHLQVRGNVYGGGGRSFSELRISTSLDLTCREEDGEEPTMGGNKDAGAA